MIARLWVVGLALAVPASAQSRVDVLIRGGSVYDGQGGPPRIADVGILGDRIVFVGDAPVGVIPGRVIDARGLIVSPGFIDPHTHTEDDAANPLRRKLAPFLAQGVTTVVMGSDGGGSFEVGAARRRLSAGLGVNAVFLVGHGMIRRHVMGMADRAPTAAELDSMRRLVAKGMEEGAIGLSTGLYYAPGSYATTEEVIELAKVASRAGGYYDSHIRDESSYTIGLLGAVDEVLKIGREASIPVHFAHIKALGVDVWGKSDEVGARILAARAAGLRVTADQYPYTASGTSLGAALLPRWAEAGGRDSLLGRIGDPKVKEKLIKEMTENLRRRGGAGSLLVTEGRWKGQRLAAIAATMKVDSIAAALEIIKTGDAGVASFNMHDTDIDRFMAQSFVVTGSDGSGGHPRKYGTFPRKIRRYALDRGVISLARAIEASSGQTARILGLADRGTLVPGNYADIAVFDSTTIEDRSTYDAPELLAAGMRFVLVNGRLALDGGKPTPTLTGRALARRER